MFHNHRIYSPCIHLCRASALAEHFIPLKKLSDHILPIRSDRSTPHLTPWDPAQCVHVQQVIVNGEWRRKSPLPEQRRSSRWSARLALSFPTANGGANRRSENKDLFYSLGTPLSKLLRDVSIYMCTHLSSKNKAVQRFLAVFTLKVHALFSCVPKKERERETPNEAIFTSCYCPRCRIWTRLETPSFLASLGVNYGLPAAREDRAEGSACLLGVWSRDKGLHWRLWGARRVLHTDGSSFDGD